MSTPKLAHTEIFLIEQDNPGGGDCGVYAFTLAVLPHLQYELLVADAEQKTDSSTCDFLKKIAVNIPELKDWDLKADVMACRFYDERDDFLNKQVLPKFHLLFRHLLVKASLDSIEKLLLNKLSNHQLQLAVIEQQLDEITAEIRKVDEQLAIEQAMLESSAALADTSIIQNNLNETRQQQANLKAAQVYFHDIKLKRLNEDSPQQNVELLNDSKAEFPPQQEKVQTIIKQQQAKRLIYLEAAVSKAMESNDRFAADILPHIRKQMGTTPPPGVDNEISGQKAVAQACQKVIKKFPDAKDNLATSVAMQLLFTTDGEEYVAREEEQTEEIWTQAAFQQSVIAQAIRERGKAGKWLSRSEISFLAETLKMDSLYWFRDITPELPREQARPLLRLKNISDSHWTTLYTQEQAVLNRINFQLLQIKRQNNVDAVKLRTMVGRFKQIHDEVERLSAELTYAESFIRNRGTVKERHAGVDQLAQKLKDHQEKLQQANSYDTLFKAHKEIRQAKTSLEKAQQQLAEFTQNFENNKQILASAPAEIQKQQAALLTVGYWADLILQQANFSDGEKLDIMYWLWEQPQHIHKLATVLSSLELLTRDKLSLLFSSADDVKKIFQQICNLEEDDLNFFKSLPQLMKDHSAIKKYQPSAGNLVEALKQSDTTVQNIRAAWLTQYVTLREKRLKYRYGIFIFGIAKEGKVAAANGLKEVLAAPNTCAVEHKAALTQKDLGDIAQYVCKYVPSI